jgi:endoglucanase
MKSKHVWSLAAALAVGSFSHSIARANSSPASANAKPDNEEEDEQGPFPLSGIRGRKLYRFSGNAVQASLRADARAKQPSADDPERGAHAACLRAAAQNPLGIWLDGRIPDVTAHVDRILQAAVKEGSIPLFVANFIPNRACGRDTSRAAKSDAEYLAWIDKFIAGVNDRPAALVLEPNALADTCYKTPPKKGGAIGAREELLHKVVEKLTQHPNIALYLDAGPVGETPPEEVKKRIRKVDPHSRAIGYAVNVGNYQTTENSEGYCEALSTDKSCLIDTSRNGNGPGAQGLCNPAGRALGQDPDLTGAGPEGRYLYTYIKVPGDSDGRCRPGNPPLGNFIPSFAIELAQNAKRCPPPVPKPAPDAPVDGATPTATPGTAAPTAAPGTTPSASAPPAATTAPAAGAMPTPSNKPMPGKSLVQ